MPSPDAPDSQSSSRREELAQLIQTARDDVAEAQRAAHEQIQSARSGLLALIAEARAEGFSHAQLAGVLGVTRARAQHLATEAKAAGHTE